MLKIHAPTLNYFAVLNGRIYTLRKSGCHAFVATRAYFYLSLMLCNLDLWCRNIKNLSLYDTNGKYTIARRWFRAVAAIFAKTFFQFRNPIGLQKNNLVLSSPELSS